MLIRFATRTGGISARRRSRSARQATAAAVRSPSRPAVRRAPSATRAARYGRCARYVALVRAVAAQLVRDRLQLPENAARDVVRACAVPDF